MTNLAELLKKIEYTVVQGDLDVDVTGIEMDSRKVSEGELFFCISGFKVDGHSFAKDVVEKGARVLIVEKDIDLKAVNEVKKPVTVVKVEDTRYAMAFISAAFYDYPADKLKVIGITGTKGKTTTTYLIKGILEKAGFKVGIIGSIEIAYGDKHIPSKNTTPESFVLQQVFADMLKAGVQIVVMEAASQGFKLHRTQGFTFELGVFTNLSPDHIGPNEHDSMEEYIECKSQLFKQCRMGIVNADDDNLLKVVKGHTCNLETYGFNKEADLFASNPVLIKNPGQLGVEFELNGNYNFTASIPTPGMFGIYNAMAAVCVCRHFDIPQDIVREALAVTTVKGRIEIVKTPYPFTLIIDYAHNALSLESILKTLREYKPSRLITLFGCGGNRSKDRRYEMGEISGKLSDFTIITSDNPRDEDPQAIIDDIKIGMHKTSGRYIEIIDRKDAIRYAMNNGRKNDIILLAGKGHEDYQEIKGIKYPMDERILIKEILEEK